MPFHEALAMRLDAMKPTKKELDTMLEEEKPELTSGVKEFVHDLRKRDVDVYFVSGGFTQMIEPIAQRVGGVSKIYANTLLFDETDGSFAGHLKSAPTSRAGGKAKVVADLKSENGYDTVIMIGDGATDMEARDIPGGADAFIGFGGVAVREAVKKGADWFVTDFKELRDALH